MFQGLRTVIYHVRDIDAAKAWYAGLLGKAPYFDEPFYVGFNVGGFELGLQPIEAMDLGDTAPKSVGVVTYWGVPDAAAAMARLLAAGAVEHEGIQDVGDGIMVGAVIDPFGNVVGIIQNLHFQIAVPTA
jgi:predicted enzyme related to lactoylglutathione lyase